MRRNLVYRVYREDGISYGKTTDVFMLPVGSKFIVWNSDWFGEIIEENGSKKILTSFGEKLELNKDKDYGLVVSLVDYSFAKMPLEKGENFKHYKGGVYEFLSLAKDSETEKELVVYADSNKQIWVREKEEFFSKVEVEGAKVDRFKRLIYNDVI